MRVVVLTTSYPRHAGDAAGHFIAAGVEQLRAAGAHVEVVSPNDFRHFGIAYGLYALGFFLPTIVKGFEQQYGTELSTMEAGLVTAVPYVIGAVANSGSVPLNNNLTVLQALAESPVKVVVDHFGFPDPQLGTRCPGYQAAVRAAEHRDDAERAVVVAALRHFQIRVVPRGREEARVAMCGCRVYHRPVPLGQPGES